jgi:hypothetical protein
MGWPDDAIDIAERAWAQAAPRDPHDPQCQLMAAPESGLPERCLEPATGLYWVRDDYTLLACDAHQGSAEDGGFFPVPSVKRPQPWPLGRVVEAVVAPALVLIGVILALLSVWRAL